MWVLHPSGGFLSAVQHNTNRHLLVVRARVRSDLEDLAASVDRPITGGDPSTDYPWRVIVARETWANYMARLAMDVDYPNFKGAVGAKDKRRASIYSRVWTALLALEDLDPRGRAQRMYYPDTDEYLTPQEDPRG